MLSLSEKHPEIFEEFHAGKFVVHKTSNKFSAMAIDQCHEQNNATVKESIGLTSNPSALRRWMVAGPEVARVVTEFEHFATGGQDDQAHLHHDQRPGVQTAFAKDVSALAAAFRELGNPFLEKSQDLLVLDTRDIADTSVIESVRKVEALGEEQYQVFVKERLDKCEKPITEVITKNKLPLFRNQSVQRHSSRQKM
jgi:predicted DsbA family dithiol-disulfide isomerase